MVGLLKELNPNAKLPDVKGGVSELDHKIAKRYMSELRMIRREVGEDGDSSEDEVYPEGIPEIERVCSKAEVERSYAEFSRNSLRTPLLVPGHKIERKRPADSPKSLLRRPDQANGQPFKMSKTEDPTKAQKSLLKPIKNDGHVAAIPAEPKKADPDCFFSLLKLLLDGFKDRRSTSEALTMAVKDWLQRTDKGRCLWIGNTEWTGKVASALKFLAGGFQEKPPDFVALLKKNPLTGTFTWVGNDYKNGGSLKSLNEIWLKVDDPEPSKAGSSSGEVVENFHAQEARRMANPDRPFTYRFQDREDVVVGPVRTQTATKVKNHPILVTDRPPCVTIIVLVLDAVARLPEGEGTKADICNLLKGSQFINKVAVMENPNSLGAVVSGALDRLQGESDPPCKYLSERKMWKYLHYGLREEDFAAMHGDKSAKATPPKQRKTRTTFGSVSPLIASAPSQEELTNSAVNSILPSDPEPPLSLPTMPLPLSTDQREVFAPNVVEASPVTAVPSPSAPEVSGVSMLKVVPSQGIRSVPVPSLSGRIPCAESGAGQATRTESILLSPQQEARQVILKSNEPSGSRQHHSLLLPKTSHEQTSPVHHQQVAVQGEEGRHVQLASPEIQRVLKRPQPSLVLPSRPSVTKNVIKITKPGGPIVVQKTEIGLLQTSRAQAPPPPSQQQILNIGGRQIILSGGNANQPLSASPQVVVTAPRPQQLQQQVMVQANIGGKTVLLSQEQARKLGLGNIRIN